MRLFIGIPLPAGVAEELSNLTKPLRSEFHRFRWTNRDAWHITLQFLGNTGQEAYECVTAKLRDIRSSAVPVKLEGFDSFVRSGAFFAGVVVTSQLEALQRRVTVTTRPCGFEPEIRPYHPHITLARSKREGNTRELRTLTDRASQTRFAPEFAAREFLLYESLLGREGSRYEVRERFTLMIG